MPTLFFIQDNKPDTWRPANDIEDNVLSTAIQDARRTDQSGVLYNDFTEKYEQFTIMITANWASHFITDDDGIQRMFYYLELPEHNGFLYN